MQEKDFDSLIIYCDGGARGNPGPAASAFVVFDKKRQKVFQQGKRIGSTTNNIAEYMAVIFALLWLKKNKQDAKEVNFYLDSELVVKQLNGTYRVKNKNLARLFFKIQELINVLPGKISFKHINRDDNKEADFLVNKTLDIKVRWLDR